MTYWIHPNNPPEYLLDAWESLYEGFGTEPFSKGAAVDFLGTRYPSLDRPSLGKLIDSFVEQGSLGYSEKEL